MQDVISSAVGGVSAGQVFEGIRRFDIWVRYRAEDRNTLEALRNLIITGPEGIKVPLAQIATLEEIIGPRQITRENNQRFISIQASHFNFIEYPASLGRRSDCPRDQWTKLICSCIRGLYCPVWYCSG